MLWLELTSERMPEAIKKAEGVCLLPMGCMERHGPHLPLGTDQNSSESSRYENRSDFLVGRLPSMACRLHPNLPILTRMHARFGRPGGRSNRPACEERG